MSFGSIFNPGLRHAEDEKVHQDTTREEEGDASGGRKIDFTKGTIKLSRTKSRKKA